MKQKYFRWSVFILVAALLLWAGIDLYAPRHVDIRHFDADEVARLDTDMWRSYYDGNRRQLFFQLAELMRLQFDFPLLRSYRVAAYAAKAAFVFKGGKNRADYEKALPYLVKYFQAIHDVSTAPFDVQHAAQLELEWWIVHRERASSHPEGDLARAVAEAAAELYQVPAKKLMDYGRLRADAMVIRDTKSTAPGGVTEDDWHRIEFDLQTSWQSLWKAVQS